MEMRLVAIVLALSATAAAQSPVSATATAQSPLSATATAQSAVSATATAQSPVSATAAAQTLLSATATAQSPLHATATAQSPLSAPATAQNPWQVQGSTDMRTTTTSSGSGISQSQSTYLALHRDSLTPGETFSVYFRQLEPYYSTLEASLVFSIAKDEQNGVKARNVTYSSASSSLSISKMEAELQIKVPNEEDLHKLTGSTQLYYWLNRHLLVLKGTGNKQFEKVASVDLQRRYADPNPDYHIFIQTDKQLYKAGQTVQYRVFVLDNEMKPRKVPLNITIKDPSGNRIKETNEPGSAFGVSGSLILSTQSMFGKEWTIHAKRGDTNDSYTEHVQFIVDEYVLPTFEVELNIPPFGTVENPELKGSVMAKYTYGKPVAGHVILQVQKQWPNWGHEFYEPLAIRTEFKIDGKADFSLPMETLLKFDPDLREHSLSVQANVTEYETGEVRILQKEISFHSSAIQLEFLTYSTDVYRPGFPFSTYVIIRQPDGRPLVSNGERVKVSATFFTFNDSTPQRMFRPPNSPSANLMTFVSPFRDGRVILAPDTYIAVPSNGVMKIDFEIPENALSGHIEVSFKDKKITKNIESFRTKSRAYINLEMKSRFAKVGEQTEFSLSSNVVPQQKIVYHIIKAGRLLGTHYMGMYSTQTSFSVKMTSVMAPEVYILAYYYKKETHEFIADGIEVNVEMSLKNEVVLGFDRNQVAPQTNLTLNIRADPDSRVFICAVDKSVLLQSGANANDVTQKRVFQKYGLPEKSTVLHGGQNLHRYRKLSGSDFNSLLSSTRLTMTTDVDMPVLELSNYVNRERLNEDTYRRSYSYDINESSGQWYGSGGGVSSVRKHFPETWLWLNESVSSTGSVNIADMVPDTITTWVATGYALNEKTGLGVAKESANVTAYLPFFVSLHLPFSIVSGEIAVIQALAFNYFPHDLYVTVRLKPSPKQFVGLIVNKYGQEEEQKEDIEHCILVRADTVESAYFMIKPKTVGTIDLTVEALTTRGRDVIQRQLIVKPPGLQEQVNVATFISLTTNGKFEKEVPVVYPLRIVPGSQRVQVSVIGDLFGPSLEHLDHLLQMPYGCGEQNMVRFAPAVAAATYLKATSRLSETLQRRVIEIMETGYQRQLTYKHSNGSYSAFSHENGSLWLTAFVLKSFAQARKFVYIDQVVVETGVRFLLDHQNQDGSFRDSGFVHNKALQGSSASTSKSLASFILITLKEIIDSAVMENKTLTAEVGHAILRTWTHLSAAAERMTGDYEMAITAYTLALMGKGGHDELLGRLEKSRSARGDGDTRFWEHSVKSQEIEIAGYALLAYARLRDTARGLPVLRWLVKQRTPYGGFLSTQDTVVALQGLAEFAILTYSKDVSMSITIDDTASVHNVTINSDNMDVLQILEVPPEARAVTVKAVGRGLALIEMSVFYNVLTEERSSNFDLRVTTNSTDAQRFELNVCARWLGSDDSGMVLMEMAFPSGFEPEPIRVQHLDEVKIEENYVVPDRREMDHGHLVLYYNKMTSDLHCYQVKVQRKSIVVKPQPVLVRVYSYYDTDHKASALYIPTYLKKPGVCDLCGYECGCGYNPDAVPQERCGFSSTMRHTYPQQEMFPQPQTAIHPHMAMYPQPAASPLVPGRYVENITSFSNFTQRLRPNMWRRGQTVPVSITRRLDEVPVHRTVSVQNSGPPMNVDPAFGLYPTAFSGFPGMPNGYSRQISTRGQTPIFDMNSVLGKSNRAIPSGFPDMTGFSRRISTRGETPISDMNSVLANWGPV